MSGFKRDSNIGQEKFDSLLEWLDPDRERAGMKYEEIRQRLVRIFIWNRCPDAENLADETIIRVAQRIEEIRKSYHGQPILYFYGVANYVRRKSHRASNVANSAADVSWDLKSVPDSIEPELQRNCLEKCLEALPRKSRELILQYYQEEKRAKIDARKRLASDFGISVNALRIRVHGIRLALQECVKNCTQNEPI